MNRLLITIAAALLLVVAPAHASFFFDGNKLHSYCLGTSVTDRMDCLGYITGVTDTLTGGAICPQDYPGRITRGQVRDIVMQFLDRHPARRSEAADMLVREALIDLWPCQRNRQQRSPTL